MRLVAFAALCGFAVMAPGCAAQRAPAPGFALDIAADDPAKTEIAADVAAAQDRIADFFGAPFAAPAHIGVFESRAAFDAALPADWGVAPTQCWMVGVGVADRLYLLSPSAWAVDACEHDATNPQEVADIITHELTHAYHGQHNATRDFTGMDDVGWFVEGLAVLVAGQMQHGHELSAAEAIKAGAAPAHLAEAWSGRYRYGVCGSMAAYIEATYGRRTLAQLLGATTQDEILGALGVSEAQFLAGWRAWVIANSGGE